MADDATPAIDERAREMAERAEGRPNLGKLLGLQFREITRDAVVATLEIRPDHHQPFGIVHGGVYCAIIEEVASVAGMTRVPEGGHVVGVNNSTDFLRAISAGTVTATGRPIHCGRSQQLWRVEITDPEGRLVALGQVRLANLGV